jgi:hypothetical protein
MDAMLEAPAADFSAGNGLLHKSVYAPVMGGDKMQTDDARYGAFVQAELNKVGSYRLGDPDPPTADLQKARVKVDETIKFSMDNELQHARELTKLYLSKKGTSDTYLWIGDEAWRGPGVLDNQDKGLSTLENTVSGLGNLPLPFYCNARKILNSLDGAFGPDGNAPDGNTYRSVSKLVSKVEVDRGTLQGVGPDSISTKKQHWDGEISALTTTSTKYSIPSIRAAILDNMRIARGVQDKVSPWTTRELVKVMQRLARTERFVESLFSVPNNGSHVNDVKLQVEKGVEKNTQADLDVIALTLLEAEEAGKRTIELQNGRANLDAAVTEAGVLADNITSSVSTSRTAKDELNLEARQNISEMHTEASELKQEYRGDMANIPHALHESNLQWVASVEGSKAGVEEELNGKLNTFSRYLVSNIEEKEQEFSDVDSRLMTLLATVEEDVEALSDLVDNIAEHRKQLPGKVDESVELVEEAGERAVKDVDAEARGAINERDWSFYPSLQTEEENAVQQIRAAVYGKDVQIDSDGQTTAADLGAMQNTVVDNAAEVESDASSALEALQDMLGDRGEAVGKLEAMGHSVLEKWFKLIGNAKDSQREFEEVLEDQSHSAADDTYAAALELNKGMVEVEQKIKDVEGHSSEQIAQVVDNVLGATVDEGQRAETELGDTEVIRADHLAAEASAVEASMNELRGSVVPASRETLLGAWNGALEKAKTISNLTSDELSVALPEVQSQEEVFEASVQAIMTDVNDKMFKSLNTSQSELNSYMLEMNKLVAQVQEKAQSAGGNIVMFLSKEDAELRNKTQNLVNGENQVEQSVNDAQADQEEVMAKENQNAKEAHEDAMKQSDKDTAAIESAENDILHLQKDTSDGVSAAGSSEYGIVSGIAHAQVNGTQVGASEALASGDASVTGTVNGTVAVVSAARNVIGEGANGSTNADAAEKEAAGLVHDGEELQKASVDTVTVAINTAANLISSETSNATETAGDEAKTEINAADTAAGGMANTGESAVTNDVEKAKNLTADLHLEVDSLALQSMSSIEKSKIEQENGTATATAAADALEKDENELTDDVAVASQLFNEQMGENAQAMKGLLEQSKHKVAGLLKDLKVSKKTVKMEQFDLDMAADLEALRQNLSEVEVPLDEEVSATWSALLGHNASYQAFEQEAHAFLASTDTFQDEAASSETAGMQTFTREYERAQKTASDAAAEMSLENDAVFGNTSESIDVLSVLRTRAFEQVKGSVDDLEKGVMHSDRELAKVLELEQYQENATLERVAGDIQSADESLRQLRMWREVADQDKKAWRDKVTDKFEEMGHALDVEALEAEEERAAQEFAVQQAMNHLTTHLSEELGTMSEAARLQIAALTAEAGAKIRELMNDTTLSDEEKARRLAEIKDKLRRDALRVLRGGVAGDLHNSAMERKLRAAKDEVMAAVAQITSYNTGAGPSRDTLDRELARVVEKVREAGANIEAGGAFPSVFMQRAATVAVDTEIATSDQRESAAWERWLSA